MDNPFACAVILPKDVLSDKPYSAMIGLPCDENGNVVAKCIRRDKQLFDEVLDERWGMRGQMNSIYRSRTSAAGFETNEQAIIYAKAALETVYLPKPAEALGKVPIEVVVV